MKEQAINKLIKRLTYIVDNNISIDNYTQANNLHATYINDSYKKIMKYYNTNPKDDRYYIIQTLYKTACAIKSDQTIKATNEQSDRAKTEIVRNDAGKIIEYKFEIYIKDKPSFTGRFNRDEMQQIYRLYSSYGSNITQREVARCFPEFSLYDFKRILRVFHITKASAPFAPHMIEELSKEELLEIQYREKENDFLKTYEAERIRLIEQQLKQALKDNVVLKEQFASFKTIVSDTINVDVKPMTIKTSQTKNSSLVLWLSDIHIGASVSDYDLYNNYYNEAEVLRRLSYIVDNVKKIITNHKNIDSLVICNLGDSIDGIDQQTTRRDHIMPQNLDNKGQIKTYYNCMLTFMKTLVTEFKNLNISYYCVGDSNHGGITDYTVNLALANMINLELGINSCVFDKNIEHFRLGDYTIIMTHGKDSGFMFKNLPLTINDKTENYINEYLDVNQIQGKVLFVKGDLHQSAITQAKRFTYKSVASLFGSSGWIMANFGNTKWGCDYSIINNDYILDGIIRE